MDAATGKMLNNFKGHKVEGYRCRSGFGHGEASVISGDENGSIWAWDLLDVSVSVWLNTARIKVHHCSLYAGGAAPSDSTAQSPPGRRALG